MNDTCSVIISLYIPFFRILFCRLPLRPILIPNFSVFLRISKILNCTSIIYVFSEYIKFLYQYRLYINKTWRFSLFPEFGSEKTILAVNGVPESPVAPTLKTLRWSASERGVLTFLSFLTVLSSRLPFLSLKKAATVDVGILGITHL